MACEHAFVTSQGSAGSRFQRACDSGDVRRAEIAFLELPKPVAALYALMLVRAYAKADDPKFERAAVRWLQQRLADGGLMLDEARVACEWLAALRDPDADLAAGSLGKLAYRRG